MMATDNKKRTRARRIVCRECAAPLPGPARTPGVRCAYCGTFNEISVPPKPRAAVESLPQMILLRQDDTRTPEERHLEETRERIADLEEQKAALKTGAAAFVMPVLKAPVVAAILMVVIAIPRCTLDIDPLMGVPGYVLCPQLCEGCVGPWRIYTPWTHRGGSHSTNGPRYFCGTRFEPLNAMSWAEWNQNWSSQPELMDAAFGANYLIMLFIALPAVLLYARKIHSENLFEVEQIDMEIEQLARDIQEEHWEPFVRELSGTKLLMAFLSVGVTAVVALILIWVDLSW